METPVVNGHGNLSLSWLHCEQQFECQVHFTLTTCLVSFGGLTGFATKFVIVFRLQIANPDSGWQG